jgi:hypothetical protein
MPLIHMQKFGNGTGRNPLLTLPLINEACGKPTEVGH